MKFLNYNDISNSSTDTCKLFMAMNDAVNDAYMRYKRLNEFRIALTKILQSRNEISLEEYSAAMMQINDETKSINDIMNEVFP